MQPARQRRRRTVTWVGTLAAVSVLAPVAAVAAPDDVSAADTGVVIDIVGINDFHGRLEASPPQAGAAVLAGAVNAIRAENPNTLFVSAGDNIGATTFVSFIQQDVPTIEVLNEMGLDVSTLGNHEFDKGRADVDDRVLPLVDFPYVSANIYDTGTGQPAYDEYSLQDVGGVTVGVIGAMTELLPELVSPAGIATLEVRDLVTEVNRVATDLSDGNEANGEADVLVVAMHEGPDGPAVEELTGDTAFADIVSGLSLEIDAVFTGHTHQRFAHLVPRTGAAALPVVGSGQYGENLARVTLTVDPATGAVTAPAATTIPLAGAYPPDPVVAQIVADAVDAAAEPGSVPLGEVTADLSRARQSGGSENRGGESTLGNLVADAQLWAANDAGIATQIAFMNPGGLRANLTYAPDGVITYQEAAAVQPFANTLVTMTLTGAQVLQVLEEQWQPAGASRPFLKLGVAGMYYLYDPTAPAGERILDAWVGGVALDPAAEYTVVVNSFLAAGGDNFGTLADGTDRTDTGRVDLEAMVDYFEASSPISPDLGQRAIGVDIASDAGFLPGTQATVHLSSLLFSAGEPAQASVPVEVDGVPVGAFPIDPAIVDTTDEVGRATVTFTMPESLDEEVVVSVVLDGRGTVEFEVPIAPTGVVTDTPVRVESNLAVAPGDEQCVQIAGVGIVPPGATGAILNVTAVRPSGVGYVTLYPSGGEQPATSTVNFETGQDVANTVVIALGEDGQVCYVTAGAPTAGVLIDVAGYTTEESGVEFVEPTRLLDTREGAPVPSRMVHEVMVAGEAGVPSDATAVILNATVVLPPGIGNLRMFPAGLDLPNTSVVNYAVDREKANGAVVELGADGKIALYNDSGSPVDVVLDVVGYTTADSMYQAITPRRLLDTRPAPLRVGDVDGPVPARTLVTLDVATAADLPPGATAVVLNVTAVQPTSTGNLRVFPAPDGDATAVPNASALNYVVGRDVPNMVVVAVPPSGQIGFWSDQFGGSVHLVVDVVGVLGEGMPV